MDLQRKDAAYAAQIRRSSLLPESYDRYTGVALSEFSEPEGGNAFLPAKILVDSLSERAGTFSMDYTDRIDAGKKGIVEIFIQCIDSFVRGHSQQIDLRRDVKGFAEIPGACICLF